MISEVLCKKLKFIILPNGICTNQNLPQRIRRKKFSGILKYKQITKPLPEKKKTGLGIVNKKEKKKRRTRRRVDFPFAPDHTVKIKENKKRTNKS